MTTSVEAQQFVNAANNQRRRAAHAERMQRIRATKRATRLAERAHRAMLAHEARWAAQRRHAALFHGYDEAVFEDRARTGLSEAMWRQQQAATVLCREALTHILEGVCFIGGYDSASDSFMERRNFANREEALRRDPLLLKKQQAALTSWVKALKKELPQASSRFRDEYLPRALWLEGYNASETKKKLLKEISDALRDEPPPQPPQPQHAVI